MDEEGKIRNGIRHICWDGCMFANDDLENPQTWTDILAVMTSVEMAVSNSLEQHE